MRKKRKLKQWKLTANSFKTLANNMANPFRTVTHPKPKRPKTYG